MNFLIEPETNEFLGCVHSDKTADKHAEAFGLFVMDSRQHLNGISWTIKSLTDLYNSLTGKSIGRLPDKTSGADRCWAELRRRADNEDMFNSLKYKPKKVSAKAIAEDKKARAAGVAYKKKMVTGKKEKIKPAPDLKMPKQKSKSVDGKIKLNECDRKLAGIRKQCFDLLRNGMKVNAYLDKAEEAGLDRGKARMNLGALRKYKIVEIV